MSDLLMPDEADDELRELLAGYDMVGYHATRLMKHELSVIRQEGLRPFSRDLFNDRIARAFLAGEIDAPTRDALMGGHMYAVGEQHQRGKREGQVCLTLSRACFQDTAGVCAPLSTWGGEGIYFSSGTIAHQQLLRSLGRPAVIQVCVPVALCRRDQLCFPRLDQVFLGVWRNLGQHADLIHCAPVPPRGIVAIWQPGEPEYDALGDLPG